MQQERRPPGHPVQPQRQGADSQVGGAAAQVTRVPDQGAQAGRAAAEPRGRVFVRGRFAGVDAVEVAAAGEREPGRSRGEPVVSCLGQPVGGRGSRTPPGRPGPAARRSSAGSGFRPAARAAAAPRPRRERRRPRRRTVRRWAARWSAALWSAAEPAPGELQSDFRQRDGGGGLPSGGREQRGPGDPEVGRVVPGRVERQAVAMFGKVRPHPQPVTLAGGQGRAKAGRTRPHHRPSRRDRSDARIPSGSNSARSFLNSASRGYISASTSAGTRESLAR